MLKVKKIKNVTIALWVALILVITYQEISDYLAPKPPNICLSSFNVIYDGRVTAMRNVPEDKKQEICDCAHEEGPKCRVSLDEKNTGSSYGRFYTDGKKLYKKEEAVPFFIHTGKGDKTENMKSKIRTVGIMFRGSDLVTFPHFWHPILQEPYNKGKIFGLDWHPLDQSKSWKFDERKISVGEYYHDENFKASKWVSEEGKGIVINCTASNAAYLTCDAFFEMGHAIKIRVRFERYLLEHWRNIMKMAVDQILEKYPEWGEGYQPLYEKDIYSKKLGYKNGK